MSERWTAEPLKCSLTDTSLEGRESSKNTLVLHFSVIIKSSDLLPISALNGATSIRRKRSRHLTLQGCLCAEVGAFGWSGISRPISCHPPFSWLSLYLGSFYRWESEGSRQFELCNTDEGKWSLSWKQMLHTFPQENRNFFLEAHLPELFNKKLSTSHVSSSGELGEVFLLLQSYALNWVTSFISPHSIKTWNLATSNI